MKNEKIIMITDIAEFTVRDHSEFVFTYCTDELYADVRQHIYLQTDQYQPSEEIDEPTLIKKASKYLDLPRKTKNRGLFLYENYAEVYHVIADMMPLSALYLLLAMREHNNPMLPIEVVISYRLMGYELKENQIVKLLTILELKDVESIFLQYEDYLPIVCALICSSLKVRTKVKTSMRWTYKC